MDATSGPAAHGFARSRKITDQFGPFHLGQVERVCNIDVQLLTACAQKIANFIFYRATAALKPAPALKRGTVCERVYFRSLAQNLFTETAVNFHRAYWYGQSGEVRVKLGRTRVLATIPGCHSNGSTAGRLHKAVVQTVR